MVCDGTHVAVYKYSYHEETLIYGCKVSVSVLHTFYTIHTLHKEKQTFRLNVYNRKFAHWRYQFCCVDSAECKTCHLVLSLCVSVSYHDNRVIVSKNLVKYTCVLAPVMNVFFEYHTHTHTHTHTHQQRGYI